MTYIYLVRHAECVETDKDIVLTKLGITQSKYIAKKLTKLKITKIYASTSTRASQTCKEFKAIKKISAIETDSLQEIYRKIIGGPEKKDTPKDRELKDKKRADDIIKKILDSSEDENIVVFTHGNFIKYFIAKILGIQNIDLWTKLSIDYGSISVIQISNKISSVKSINNIDHLDKKSIQLTYTHKEKYF